VQANIDFCAAGCQDVFDPARGPFKRRREPSSERSKSNVSGAEQFVRVLFSLL